MGLTHIVKRDGRIVRFDSDKITDRIYQAAVSTGGFKQDIDSLPSQLANEIYQPYLSANEQDIAEDLTCQVVDHLISQGLKHLKVEQAQDAVEYVLKSQAFVDVWEAYRLYRWSRTAIRDDIITEEQFSISGLPEQKCQEIEEWNQKHGCATISALNGIVGDPKAYQSLVESSIQEYERELDNILEAYKKNPSRLVFIAGPSSSGKTTTTNKVVERIESLGLKCKFWTIDNYYKGLEHIPQDQFGDYDYETPDALDLGLIQKHLPNLFAGNKVSVPFYSFEKGERDGISTRMQLTDDEVLVVDSLYSLSPQMFPEDILSEKAFKIYIETLNMVQDSTGRQVKLTDNRLLRRMARDSRPQSEGGRGYPVDHTLGHWHYVRKGELRYLIPFMNTADYIINGSLAFELPILKKNLASKLPKLDLEPFRKQKRWDAVIRGHRIKKLLDELVSTSDQFVPEDCHLREFIGKSKR